MPRDTIRESVGSRVETETTCRSLEKPPSCAHRESGASGMPVTETRRRHDLPRKDPERLLALGGESVDGVLRPGEQGIGVRTLQHRLNQLGVLDAQGETLVVDGEFGARTREAVECFQRQRGLEVDGVVGRETLRELGAARREIALLTAADPAGGVPVQQGRADLP